jgi:hypothetical protein
MISARKLEANRANARLSTGARTAVGKARSAQNALRHCLSLPVLTNPILSAEVEALAQEIAGPGASAGLLELARRIAEAEIDLIRVRRARHELIAQALANPNYRRAADLKRNQKHIARSFLRYIGMDRRMAASLQTFSPDFVMSMSKCLDPAYYLFLEKPESLLSTYLSVPEKLEGPEKFSTILSEVARQLSAMDRYERRAISRRKFAIHAFDAARL